MHIESDHRDADELLKSKMPVKFNQLGLIETIIFIEFHGSYNECYNLMIISWKTIVLSGIYFPMEKNHKIGSLANEKEFEKVFRVYFIPLTHYSYKFVKDVDSAKEIVHKVFIKLWEKRHEIHTQTPVKSYLFTAVHNRSLNHIRDNARFETGSTKEIENIPDAGWEETAELESIELEIRILKEINVLPDRCSEIFKLARFENMKYREIAEKLGISVKTVEAQMSKALKILRHKFSEFVKLIIFWNFYFFNTFQ